MTYPIQKNASSGWRDRARALALALPLAWSVNAVWAQAPVPTPDVDHLTYQMKRGDTFIGLVNRFMEGSDSLKQIIAINSFPNLYRIPVGAQVKVPRSRLKHVPSTATVSRLNCDSVIQIDGNTAVPIKMGSVLGEGSVVRIPAGCQFALTLEDDSNLRLMSGAVIKLKTLRRNPLEASPEVKVELLDGRIEIDVPKKRRQTDAPFQVITHTSVAGVRGTEFQVGFDAIQGNSQVEVMVGIVGVRGLADVSEKRANAGQGVAITADGKSLDIETLLMPLRFDSGLAQQGGKDWLLKFNADPLAQRFLLGTGEDANFSALVSQEQLTQPQVLAPALGSKPVFYKWSSISASGLMGQSQDYAICKGYERQDLWRCNVPFNVQGLSNPHLLLQKVETQAPVLDLFNGPVKATVDKSPVFLRGLPSGVYRWRIEYDITTSMKAAINGQFELVALPGTD